MKLPIQHDLTIKKGRRLEISLPQKTSLVTKRKLRNDYIKVIFVCQIKFDWSLLDRRPNLSQSTLLIYSQHSNSTFLFCSHFRYEMKMCFSDFFFQLNIELSLLFLSPFPPYFLSLKHTKSRWANKNYGDFFAGASTKESFSFTLCFHSLD